MSTRSRIGFQLSDGSVLSSYHHWDGYPEWLGKTLTEHYNNKELATELIDGGDMSSCWCIDRWTKDGSYNAEEYGPQYYSDRQDRDCEPRYDMSLKTYLGNGEEYAYLFTDGQWVCYDLHSDNPNQVEIPA